MTHQVPPIPRRMARLPLDSAGRPVPRFATWVDGKPDFRVVQPEWVGRAARLRLCWVCGEPLGAHLAFVIGPMCLINRISSEPPSHRECAEWSAQACPFLINPNKDRRVGNLPPEHSPPAGVFVERNPGVTIVYVTRSWSVVQAPEGGQLIRMGEPTGLTCWKEGRTATRAEVEESIESGLPTLEQACGGDLKALAMLQSELAKARALPLPA